MLHRLEWVARHNVSNTLPRFARLAGLLPAVFLPMATIDRLALENRTSDRSAGLAAAAAAWAQGRGVSLRDAVLLLPFTQLLPHARRAFAGAGGWMPRIETTRTLAASLGPAAPAVSGQVSFDVAIDVLS